MTDTSGGGHGRACVGGYAEGGSGVRSLNRASSCVHVRNEPGAVWKMGWRG